MNWLVRFMARALEPAEREAVLGDLTERGSSNTQAMLDVLGLAVRRQLMIWRTWRPWFALIGIVGLSGFYLSGMIMRLAFSVAIQCEPDILLIDEVLSVGDASFQEKSRDALVAFRRAGKSILFVSHSATSVREMCDRAVWIDHGAVMMDGEINEVLDAYQGRAVVQQRL